MNGPRRSGPGPNDPGEGDSDGWRPSRGYLAAALAIVVGGLVLLSMSSPSSTPVAADTAKALTVPVASNGVASDASMPAVVAPRPLPPPAPTPARAASGSAPGETQQVSRTRDPDGDQTPDISDYVNQGEKPTMGEVIDRLHQAGVYSGLGAFSPPGTRPPLIGLAVPEDFALPEGYVRHYQATDDGQRIEPILMFSPDVRWPFAIPADRVVPPELAPPGLPIRRVEIPTPTPGK